MFLTKTIKLKLSPIKLLAICIVSVLLIANVILLWDVSQHHGVGSHGMERDIVSQDGIVSHQDKYNTKRSDAGDCG